MFDTARRLIVTTALVAAGVAWQPGAGVGRIVAAPQAAASPGNSFDSRIDFSSRSRCAVRDPGGAVESAIEQALNASRAVDPKGTLTVPVYWHIITTETGDANVSALVPAQMQVLEETYAPSGITFEVQQIQVTPNNAWFFAELGSDEEVEMKATLRRGGPEALNVYTTNGDVYLGWATFPFFYKFFPGYDGVVLWWAALPGTGLAGAHPNEPDGILTYDQGDTATHEVGHWLGLYHTFSGGCSHPGDRIKDTPAEAGPQFFCAARDSCAGPVFRGADDITNFMNYVDDVCMDHFTGEQTKRMRKEWHAFRDKKARN